MGRPFLFIPADGQHDFIRAAATAAGVPMAEVLRRMIDRCATPAVINELFPCVSGQYDLGQLIGDAR